MTRALVLAGGGANGAYEVGALRYLLKKLQFNFPILTGISVGALNAAILAQYPQGEELQAYEEMLRVWNLVKGNKSIYKDWPWWGKIAAIKKHSVYCTAPLRKLVYDNLDLDKVAHSKRKLRVGAVDLATGRLHYWNEKDRDLKQGVLASSAFPVMFEPVYKGDAVYTDGGVREVAPLRKAIEMGATEIVVITPDPENPAPDTRSRWTSIDVAVRSLGLMMDEILDNDLDQLRTVNATIKLAGQNAVKGKRTIRLLVIRPQKPLGDSLDFSQAKRNRLMKRGYADARAAMLGPQALPLR